MGIEQLLICPVNSEVAWRALGQQGTFSRASADKAIVQVLKCSTCSVSTLHLSNKPYKLRRMWWQRRQCKHGCKKIGKTEDDNELRTYASSRGQQAFNSSQLFPRVAKICKVTKVLIAGAAIKRKYICGENMIRQQLLCNMWTAEVQQKGIQEGLLITNNSINRSPHFN